MRQINSSTGRSYQLPTGETLPSVTTVLRSLGKEFLIDWAAREERKLVVEAASDLYEDLPIGHQMSRLAFHMSLERRLPGSRAHQTRLAAAASLGTSLHKVAEWTLAQEIGKATGGRPPLSPEFEKSFARFEAWRKAVDLKAVHVEFPVWSREWGYAGTQDLLGHLTHQGNRILAVGDWKSGAAIYVEAELQVAAYVNAIEEMGHSTPGETWGLVVRFSKDPNADPPFETKLLTPDDVQARLKIFLNLLQVYNGLKALKDPPAPLARPMATVEAAATFDFAA
jgi:hypothetical protein